MINKTFVFITLCFLLAGTSTAASKTRMEMSFGTGVESHSQNNFLRHWDNSVGGIPLSVGILMVNQALSIWELELNLNTGTFRDSIDGELTEKTGFNSVDLRWGVLAALGERDVRPMLGIGAILYNGFAPRPSEDVVESEIYKGLGMYFCLGPSFEFSKTGRLLIDANYAYMGNLGKESYDPMGIIKLRIRFSFMI